MTFHTTATEKLVNELLKITIQESDQEGEEVRIERGIYAEPIQLQVVCLKLWNARRPDPSKITLEDVENSGNVDTALGDYYDDVLKQIA